MPQGGQNCRIGAASRPPAQADPRAQWARVRPVERAPWATIPQLVDDAAARFSDTEAFSDGEVKLSFSELVETVHDTARALLAWGLRPGDRVALWAPNILEWIQAALAVHCTGGVLVTVNTRFKGSEAAYLLNRSKARFVFTVSDFLGADYAAILQGRDDLECLEHIIVLRGPASGDAVPFASFLARADEISPAERASRATAVRGNDLCHVLFTSGTTGAPKGVMLEHQAVCDVYLNLANVFDMRYGDRQLVVLPFFHSFGLHVGILCAFMRGITILPQSVFDPDAVMQRIQDDRVTLFPGPPTVFQAMLDSPRRDEFDLTSLRCVTIGSAGFPPHLVGDIMQRLGVPEVRNGFGITESSGTVSLVRAGESAEVITNTVGRPLPGIEVKIIADDGKEQPVGERGEVLVRGYTIMRGYLDDPEATARAVDADGWLHTGDVGLFRSDGNLVIVDRIKDMFTVGGFNAYPAEIEAVLARHPAVARVAVVGVPDERLGDVGMAFVVPATAGTDPAALLSWARQEMANYKVPRYVELVDELPTNATGKIQKTDLRSRAAEILAH
jgi:acyl-CoA synthetase (AMP-forming)/AMP-acid ligase II